MAGRFLVLKGYAGMSNRIRVALTGVLYAMITGRTLVVDWSDPSYSTDGTNSFPRFFGLRNVAHQWELPESDSVHPAIWRGRLGQSVRALWESLPPGERGPDMNASRPLLSLADIGETERPEEVVVYWGTDHRILPLASHFTMSTSLRHYGGELDALAFLLGNCLTLSPDVAARVEAQRATFPPGPMLGVHVRHSCIRSPLNRFLAAMDLFRERHPDHGLFLATDNREVLEAFRNRYGAVASTDKWYPQAGEMMGENPDCPDPLGQGLEALVDMWLLGACDRLMYYSQSTFYQIPLLLRRYPAASLTDVGFLD